MERLGWASSNPSLPVALPPPNPSNRRPLTPRSCIPSAANCQRPVRSEILLRSKESFSSKSRALVFRCRAQSLLFPCAPLRAHDPSPTRYLLLHPPAKISRRSPFAASHPQRSSPSPAFLPH